MDPRSLPPEILDILAKPLAERSLRDRNVLQSYLVNSTGSIDPEIANVVGHAISQIDPNTAPPAGPVSIDQAPSDIPGQNWQAEPESGGALGLGIGNPMDAVLDWAGSFGPDSPPPAGPMPPYSPLAGDPQMGPTISPFGERPRQQIGSGTPGMGDVIGAGGMGSETMGLPPGPGDLADFLGPDMEDSAYAGVYPEFYGLYDDPHFAAQAISAQRGGGANTARYLEPFIESGQAMAAAGMLGYGTGEYALGSGPTSNATRLRATEDWVNQLNRPGAVVDAAAIYQDALARAAATDPMTMTGPSGEGAGEPGNQIDITNSALMAMAPYMPQDSAAAIKARLDQAGTQYMMMVSRGETGMSYPEYLRSIGADRWLGGSF